MNNVCKIKSNSERAGDHICISIHSDIMDILFFLLPIRNFIRGHDPRIEVEVRMISADKVRTDMKISAPADHRENGQTKDIGSQTFKGKQTNKHTLTNTQE